MNRLITTCIYCFVILNQFIIYKRQNCIFNYLNVIGFAILSLTLYPTTNSLKIVFSILFILFLKEKKIEASVKVIE